MKVSKNSWHYRVIDCASTGSPSTSLCKYLWQLVGTLLLWSIGLAVVLFMVVFLLITLSAPLVSLFTTIPVALKGSVEVGYMLWTGIVVLFGWYAWKKYQKNHLKEEKEPGIVKSYYRAKKEKICPVIDFTEE